MKHTYRTYFPVLWLREIGMPTVNSSNGPQIVPGSDPMPCGEIYSYRSDHAERCLHVRTIGVTKWLLLQAGWGEDIRFALVPESAVEFVG